MTVNLAETTVRSSRDAIASGSHSSERLTRAYLERIRTLDDRLHAFNEVAEERAMERARAVDAGRIAGSLAGVPVAIKDNFCTAWGRTTCSSRMLGNFHAPYTATAVQRLEAAGAVVLGKCNHDEFAMGSSTEHSAWAPSRNPWDVDRVPGGSSGGSAAAVAADLCAGGLASDTGGSIRQPAAMCGVVGLKPTYGLVSRYGLVAFASSLDQIGPISHTTEDAALLLEAIAGADPMDGTSTDGAGNYAEELDRPVDGLRVGIPREYLAEGNEPGVNQAVHRAAETLERLGVVVTEVDLPHTEYALAAYYIVAPAEASSNLARYDGVHYGRRSTETRDLSSLYEASRSEGFGNEVKRRIMLGTFALSSGYYDAYYLRAQKVRRLIKQDFDRAFERVDALVCPTTPGPAFRLGEKTGSPLQMYFSDVYTAPASLAGIAGLSVPGGFTEVDGSAIPVGVQLLGPPFGETTLLRLGHALENVTRHTEARPSLESWRGA